MAYNSQHWDWGQTEILCDVCKIQSGMSGLGLRLALCGLVNIPEFSKE